MPTVAPDTMKFIRLLTKEKGYERDSKIALQKFNVIIFLGVLIETKKRYDGKMKEVLSSVITHTIPILDEYADDSQLRDFAQRISAMIQRDEPTSKMVGEVRQEIKDHSKSIAEFLEGCMATLFPNPNCKECSPLSVTTEKKSEVIAYLNRVPNGSTDELPGGAIIGRRYIKSETIEKFGLGEYERKAKNLIVTVGLKWKKYRHDSHLLTLYLKAKEIWKDLTLLTDEDSLIALGNKVREFWVKKSM